MGFKFFDLGLIDFKQAWDFQKEIHSRVKNNEFNIALIFCQHYPVITLGRSALRKNILASQNELSTKGIGIYEIERGGDVTYHGPGQLVIYPVCDLNYLRKDIHLFLRKLEEAAMAILSEFGIQGERRGGLTGVWVENKKIASIGISIKNWITYHGLALNIKADDLGNFSLIRPCGMNIMMTSMETALGKKLSLDSVKKSFLRAFCNLFSQSADNCFRDTSAIDIRNGLRLAAERPY
jgi:lipoate-protein ligase B